jgi:hypothetical protein
VRHAADIDDLRPPLEGVSRIATDTSHRAALPARPIPALRPQGP